eukprot:TRINITY_DN32530_c0_g1_i1.p1 TRINITY_DN32530_c0_g1~~TRINITY_DN32530_c0_g1_i1.p1  ORF type:complete len:623 (+),score=123.87 TRINITY_DN32530_c0_g1_i1:302-2170(+)
MSSNLRLKLLLHSQKECVEGKSTKRPFLPIDPHSFTDGNQPLTTDVTLQLRVDFKAKKLAGSATLKLASKASGALNLDTRGLVIKGAKDSIGREVKFQLVVPADPIKGTLLLLELYDDSVTIMYETTEASTAIQWLSPEQTGGGKQPYVYTQCQAIHARSVFPCQDTPLARIRYKAVVLAPADTSVVMSASLVATVQLADLTMFTFDMPQPIPPYLFALAAGDVVHKNISPRCGIYAERSILDAAVYEFADMDKMVSTAESLFGPYEWSVFNVLVLPPSFPYGGMENPRMVFLTPTILSGDRANVNVVAHELAHSWTGNLVTNATANDFWLNEGWTTYAERRIQEALEGEERALLYAAIGWTALQEALQAYAPQFTRLKMALEGVDPDEVYSEIPYEKGALFLKRLEIEVGRPAFDVFIQKYIAKFRFQSISTETFIAFLIENLPGISQRVDLNTWIHGEGLPADAPRAQSERLTRITSLAGDYVEGRSLTPEDVADWQAPEWQMYLGMLPKKMPKAKVAELDAAFSFSKSSNWELRIAFLTIAAYSAFSPCYPGIETALMEVGRMKYLKPLYEGLVAGGALALAKEIFAKAKVKYHSIARQVVEAVLGGEVYISFTARRRK